MNKVMDVDDAVRDIPDGATIAIACFGNHRWPSTLIQALLRQGAKELTLVCNTVGTGPRSANVLVEAGRVRHLMAAHSMHPGLPSAADHLIAEGKMTFELVPQGTLVERLRAGGSGIAAFYTPTGAETAAARGKETRQFGGVPHVLETALRVDYAFIRAARADEWGNLEYRGTSRNFNPIFAQAARITIAEADEIVPVGALDPERVGTPSIFVDRVVQAVVVGNPIEDNAAAFRLRPRRADDMPRTYLGRPARTRLQIAKRVAHHLREGTYVNLGVGLPTLVSNFIGGRNVILHTENGMLGYGSIQDPSRGDPDVFNAGGQLVSSLPGAAFFDSLTAHAMGRGGHLDTVVLGAYQVSARGDLANWSAPGMAGGSVGGAMDLIAGNAEVIVMMEHCDRNGSPKIVSELSYPATGWRVVDWIFTDLAVIRVTENGLELREVAPGFTPDEIRQLTGAPLYVGERIELYAAE